MLSKKEIEERLADSLAYEAQWKLTTGAYSQVLQTAQQLVEWLDDVTRALAWDSDTNDHCIGCPRAYPNGPLCQLDMDTGWPCEISADKARAWLEGKDE